ncbi:MAG: arsenic resistance protein [Lachnospiraceae bacterium]|nr:arsenic resistance protein [Lachnospiraceae bacterium]
MDLFTKLQPVWIIAAAGVGLLLGYVTPFGKFSVYLVEPFLMVLLYFVFLSVDGSRFRESVKNLRFTLTAVVINFIWTPLFAWLLGRLFFAQSVDLQMGLVMLLVTPCTDWYLVFTGLAKGNVELGASILPLNLLLQILLLPVYLMLFFGGTVQMNHSQVILSIVFVLIIPFAASLLTKAIGKQRPDWNNKIDRLKEFGDQMQLIFLCLAVISMFASESKDVFENPELLIRMLLPVLLFFCVNFFAARLAGRAMKFPGEDITALNFTTLARNSPLSLAIAVAAFPDRPLIALALVIGPLIELPSLGVIAGIINTGNKK